MFWGLVRAWMLESTVELCSRLEGGKAQIIAYVLWDFVPSRAPLVSLPCPG